MIRTNKGDKEMKYNKIILVFILAIIIILASGCGKKEVEVAPAVSDTTEEMEVEEEPEKSEKQEEELTELEETELEELEKSPESETEIVDNEISDNWMDGEFLLDGVKLKMPCSYEDVTKTGWAFERSDSGYVVEYIDENDNIDEELSVSYTVPANSDLDIYLFNKAYENDAISILLHNPTEHELDAEECVVRGFFQFTSFNVAHEEAPAVAQIILPKEITYGATADEVIAAYGEPSDMESDSELIYMTYENEETYFRMQFVFEDGFGLDTIRFYWDEWN